MNTSKSISYWHLAIHVAIWAVVILGLLFGAIGAVIGVFFMGSHPVIIVFSVIMLIAAFLCYEIAKSKVKELMKTRELKRQYGNVRELTIKMIRGEYAFLERGRQLTFKEIWQKVTARNELAATYLSDGLRELECSGFVSLHSIGPAGQLVIIETPVRDWK